jgi:hypothetical protein
MRAKLPRRRATKSSNARGQVPVLDWQEFLFIAQVASAAIQGRMANVSYADAPEKRVANVILDQCGGNAEKASAMLQRFVALQPMMLSDRITAYKRDESSHGAIYHNAVFIAGATAPLKTGSMSFDADVFFNHVRYIRTQLADDNTAAD